MCAYFRDLFVFSIGAEGCQHFPRLVKERKTTVVNSMHVFVTELVSIV
jgi:hypothetical protein